MWSFIEERVEKLEPSDLEKVKAANYGHVPEFAGFDGNNESELMNIAHFRKSRNESLLALQRA